jgi:hypothetical protein
MKNAYPDYNVRREELLSCPGVEPAGVELGDRDKLMANDPGLCDEIDEFIR